jgi:hypothetical protein
VSVGKINPINTQKYITKYLSGKNLNELIHRVKMKILDKHIENALKKNHLWPKDIEIELKSDKRNELDLYIIFKENDDEKAHISLHVTGMNYSQSLCGPYHIKIKEAIYAKSGMKRDACCLIKTVKHSKNKLGLAFIEKNKFTRKNLSNVFANNTEYNVVLELLNEYFDYSAPLSLHIDISGKRDLIHPLLKKAENTKMIKTFLSKKVNLSKTQRQIICKASKINPSERFTYKLKKRIPFFNIKSRKKFFNKKSKIEYNILNLNAKSKKSIKNFNPLNNNAINVTHTL